MSKPKLETLRCLLVGNLLKLFRHRYGPTLPDDDAGRDDLRPLLYVCSLARFDPEMKMRNQIETVARWMRAAEAKEMIEYEMHLTVGGRRLSAKQIGERVNLKNADRERLKLWQIAVVDMTAEQIVEQKKAKDRARKRKRSKRTRAEYLAASLTTSKPWEANGISRRTWERRRRVAGMSALRVNTLGRTCVKADADGAGPWRAAPAPASRPFTTNKANGEADECQSASTADILASPSTGASLDPELGKKRAERKLKPMARQPMEPS